MALDQVVDWKTDLRPSRDNLQAMLEDYFGAFATSVVWRDNRFWVTLVGGRSSAMRRQEGLTPASYAYNEELATEDGKPTPRMIEVYPHEDCLYVMTREADEATNGLARDFAHRCAGFWKGELQLG
ncbi:MAG: hypothetical protein ACHREM_01155 [Polyangiales bacterium]